MPAFFTQEELAIAKDTDLPDLLSSLGYQVKRVGNYHTVREMDSLRVKNRRSWFRYSEGIGGDAIAFVQHFCQKSFYSVSWQFYGEATKPKTLSYNYMTVRLIFHALRL